MTDDRNEPRPLSERLSEVKEHLGKVAEEFFDAVADALNPPRPVPIPVRKRQPRY